MGARQMTQYGLELLKECNDYAYRLGTFKALVFSLRYNKQVKIPKRLLSLIDEEIAKEKKRDGR